MKYLRYFKTTNAYDSATLDLPNVSYIEDRGVHYNPKPSIVSVGDVVYWKDGSIKTIPFNKYDISIGSAIGVVVIPPDIAPDGKCRIISLKWANTDGTMSDSPITMTWGQHGSTTPLESLNRVPVNNSSSGTINSSGYFPSDTFKGIQSDSDPSAYYIDNVQDSLIPSPYLGESINPEYISSYIGVHNYRNALSDFNGLSNTQILKDLSWWYAVAIASWNYNDGTESNIQWYLPSAGELGFLMARLSLINNTLNLIYGAPINNESVGCSTYYDSFNAWRVLVSSGKFNTTTRLDGKYWTARPFAIIDIN